MFPNQAQSKEFLRPYFQSPPPLPITSNQSIHQGSGGFFGAIKQSTSSQNCFSPTATTNQEPSPPPIYHGFFGAPAPPVKQSASSQNNFSPTTPTQEPRPMPPPSLMQQCPPPFNHLVQPPPFMSIFHRPHKTSSIQEYYPPSAAHNNDDATNIDDYYENYDEYYESYEDNQQGEYRGRREEKLARRTRTYFCDICSIQCVGEQAWQSHLEGKNHKKKLNNSQQGTSFATANGQKPAYHCEICNIDCTGADSYKTHINGQKHQKAIKLLLKVNKPIPMTEISMIMPADVAATSGGGEEGQQSQPNKSRKRTLTDSLGDNPNKIPLLNANAPELINDNYIAEKIGQIELHEEQKTKLEEFVLLVETTLWNVSNQVELNRRNAQPANFPPADGPSSPKLLRGIMRVGLLANQLLLKTDRRANLVILCSEIPTIALLKQTADLFRRNINETWRNQNSAANEFSIVEMVSESAFRVSRTGIDISIFVTLSCLAMRQWSPGDLNYHPYQRPPNALPEIPCLNALAEMRRTKFYQAKFQQFTSMNWTVKIVRDFGYRAMQEKWGDRVPAWSRLSDWMIILIVEKAISMYSAQTASPSVALKSLFNAISDGHIFGSLQNDFVAQLPDPCEKQFTDSIASLTASERKNIWASTNYSLKQMNKNNLAGLLALEGTGGSKNHHNDERKKKRPNSSAGIGGGAQQKEGPSAEHNNSSRSEQLKPKHGKTNWNGQPMNQ